MLDAMKQYSNGYFGMLPKGGELGLAGGGSLESMRKEGGFMVVG